MALAGQPRCFLVIVIGLDSARHAVSWLVKVRVCVCDKAPVACHPPSGGPLTLNHSENHQTG